MKYRTILAAALTLLCGLVAIAAEPRTEIHFPDVPGYHTLKCDFHTHTVFSDGVVWPTVRIDEAWREGLDALAITDHIEYQPHREDVPTNHNRPYELALGKATEHGILLVRGTEITRSTPPGHFNALFLDDIKPLDTEDFHEVFKQAQQQSAFVFWNHPGWKGPELGRWGAEQTELFENKRLHGIEICNGDDYYAEAHQIAMDKNLVMLGNSDIHSPSRDSARTPADHRTLTLALATERTVPALREALFAGRTAVWYQNQLIGWEDVLAPLFAACVQVEPPHHQADDSTWANIHNRGEVDIELERVGQGRPEHIKLAARATSLVRFRNAAEEPPEGSQYRVLNLLIGPGQPLTIRLKIPPASE